MSSKFFYKSRVLLFVLTALSATQSQAVVFNYKIPMQPLCERILTQRSRTFRSNVPTGFMGDAAIAEATPTEIRERLNRRITLMQGALEQTEVGLYDRDARATDLKRYARISRFLDRYEASGQRQQEGFVRLGKIEGAAAIDRFTTTYLGGLSRDSIRDLRSRTIRKQKLRFLIAIVAFLGAYGVTEILPGHGQPLVQATMLVPAFIAVVATWAVSLFRTVQAWALNKEFSQMLDLSQGIRSSGQEFGPPEAVEFHHRIGRENISIFFDNQDLDHPVLDFIIWKG